MVDKIKFTELELPLINEGVYVIERPLKEFDGKSVIIDLTRRLRGKGAEISFKLKVENDKIIVSPNRINILGFFIRRMMRKGINYVEDSFDIQCKDAILKIKPFLITRKKVHRSVRNALRIKTKQELTEYVKDKNYEEIFLEILQDNLQKNLSRKLKKVYPLSFCDIRDIFVVKKI